MTQAILSRMAVLAGLLAGAVRLPAAARDCESLTSLTIPKTEVISAVPSSRAGKSFCQVTAFVRPVEDSEINWVFHDPGWNPLAFDFDREMAYADAQMSFLVANDSDLSAFHARKGKLLVYHGWADPVAPPEDSIRYYESVAPAAVIR